ncbi:DUF2339 domain-containing protein [Terricaulis silvestris]|uniref:DUF2339 domain-containing protein n=1 Tax=Terricaulis silvestris TaxID=2686094 RepID=A0A6I6MI39_9CAUL|nr:hypothetical protein [Terricaulis silvestris]QGZ94670.1 hypothetical protein DSM104635_01497 [Terricaulis silvestris]
MALVLLLALHVVLSIAGFAVLWRRIESLEAQLGALRDGSAEARPENPLTRAARVWGERAEAVAGNLRGPTLSPETGRGLVLALMATSPAIAFFFQADQPAIVASGLAIAAAMMIIALRPIWRAAAWAAVCTAGAWALVGFALGAAHADPASYSIFVAFCAVAGITHAHLRRATPGSTMALTMAAAALALASQTGMVGAAGVAFGMIVAVAAIVGAMSLRLEAMHLAAFGAAVIGLFVLSGQPSAAIWFTPAAAWAGALFLAIAAVRVPQLGARGVALAGTGAFAPLGAIAALNAAQHGLANPYAAAGAFLGLAALLAGVIAQSALRRARGLEGLRVTLWVLVLGAFVAVSAAIALALPVQLAAPASAALALGLVALDERLRNDVWRFFAAMAGVGALMFAALTARAVLGEAVAWPPFAVIATGVVLSSALAGATAFVLMRTKSARISAFFELSAIAFALGAANLAVRVGFTEGAPLLRPVTFVETGVHAAIWLTAALMIGARAKLGAVSAREFAMRALGLLALAALTVSAGLHAATFAAPLDAGLMTRASLGFALPAALFWGHWAFWRTRRDESEARWALGAAAVSTATFLIIEAAHAETLPEWARAAAVALSIGAAIGVNFAPGVTRAPEPLKLPEKSPSRVERQAAHSDAA